MTTRTACRLVACALWMMPATVMRAQSAISTSASAFLVDRYFSPSAGASTLHAAQDVLLSVESRFVPDKLTREDSRLGRIGGIFYRAAKFTGFDVAQDHMAMVVAHEVFGHGARLRELGDGKISYGFDTPIPYGDGSAVTRFNGEFPDSPLALLAVDAAGLEAQNALADNILRRAVSRGRLNYREAWLYFESRVTSLSYIQSASENSSEGHDIANFIETFAEACFAPACTPLTTRQIQNNSWLILADPMLYHAIYTFAGSYVGKGESTSIVPTIAIGFGARAIPVVGFQLTPYGTEKLVRVFAAESTRISPPDAWQPQVVEAGVRFGATGASTPWGASLRVRDAVRISRLSIDGSFELWRQPPLDGDVTFAPLETGTALLVTTDIPLPNRLRSSWSQAFRLTAGYKSLGFVPGEQLDSGFVIRVGLAMRE